MRAVRNVVRTTFRSAKLKKST